MVRPEKATAVEEITSRFNESQAALLTEYRGLTVGELAELRGALREADAEYKVLKNTLARIAVREVGLEDLVGMLEGPTAIAFVKGDAVDAAKALDDAAKRFPVLVIKGGVLKGKIIDADQAKALAGLEPREVQLAKIVMMVNAPVQQTVNVFAALLRDFGSMLAQVVAKKESGELPAGDAPDPTPEAAPDPTPEAAAPTEETPPAESAPPEAGSAETATADGSTGETDRGEAAAEASEVAAEVSSDTTQEVADSDAAEAEASGTAEPADQPSDEAADGGADKEE